MSHDGGPREPPRASRDGTPAAGVVATDADRVRARYEEALRRSGAVYADHLEELGECNHGLARLVHVRSVRQWTDFEHDSYLLLRKSRSALNARAALVQRAFERARVRLRDLEQPR